MSVHVAIIVKLCLSIRREKDKLRRAFISMGTDKALGDQCMVTWSKVTRPVELGGLGILDLTTLGYALHLHWAWLARVDPYQISSLPIIQRPSINKEERIIQAMFKSSTMVQVGNGASALFWIDRWMDGSSISSMAPDVLEAVPKRVQRTRVVTDGIKNNTWIRDISGSLSATALAQYVAL
jgi:hypothetical protein